MDEDAICKRYRAEIDLLCHLDHAYYCQKNPSPADRAAYFARQDEREAIRARLAAELGANQSKKPPARTTFTIRVEDKAMHTRTTCGPFCKLSHDLRNHVGVVLGRCQLLSQLSPDPAVAEHLAAILHAAEKMRDLVRENTCPQHPAQPSRAKNGGHLGG